MLVRNVNTEERAIDAVKLNRLLQLCSANLPVGGFAFSQGLEFAVEAGWLHNVATTSSWISLNLQESITRTDLAILKRLYTALDEQNFDAFITWNQHLIACRESQELLLADVAMGKALVRLIKQLNRVDSERYQPLLALKDISLSLIHI